MENNEFTGFLALIQNGLDNLADANLFKTILVDSTTVLRLTDSDMAVEMQIDRSTVNRWRSGVSSPNPIMRKSIYVWLKRRSNQMVKAIEKQNQDSKNDSNKKTAAPEKN